MKKGTDATISCAITGLSAANAAVTWKDSEGTAVTGDNFTPVAGTQDSGAQTATLLVKAAAVTEDKAYSCEVKSGTLAL